MISNMLCSRQAKSNCKCKCLSDSQRARAFRTTAHLHTLPSAARSALRVARMLIVGLPRGSTTHGRSVSRTVAGAHGLYGECSADTRAVAASGVARIAQRAVGRDRRKRPAQLVFIHLATPLACLWRSVCVKVHMYTWRPPLPACGALSAWKCKHCVLRVMMAGGGALACACTRAGMPHDSHIMGWHSSTWGQERGRIPALL